MRKTIIMALFFVVASFQKTNAQNATNAYASYMNLLSQQNNWGWYYYGMNDGRVRISDLATGQIITYGYLMPNWQNAFPVNTGSFTNWLSNFNAPLANAMNSYFQTGQLPGGEGGGPEIDCDSGGEGEGECDELDFGWEPGPDGFGYNPSDPNSPDWGFMFNPSFDPTLSPQDEEMLNNLNFFYDIFAYSNVVQFDCTGTMNGTAYQDICGSCVGGATNATPCNTTLPAKDTLQPIKINCDSAAINRDSTAKAILDSVKNTPEMNNIRGGAYTRKFETGFTINRSKPQDKEIYKPKNLDTTGTGSNVTLLHDNNSIADVHVHPFIDSAGNTKVQGPSPADCFGLIKSWLSFPSKRFKVRYIVKGDSTDFDYAIMISDTTKADNFFSLNPRDSVISTLTDSVHMNHWRGDEKDKTSLFYSFKQAYKKFEKEGYPQKHLETYANVFMLQKLDMGIRIMRNVNGEFKELSFEEITGTNGKKQYRIKICN